MRSMVSDEECSYCIGCIGVVAEFRSRLHRLVAAGTDDAYDFATVFYVRGRRLFRFTRRAG